MTRFWKAALGAALLSGCLGPRVPAPPVPVPEIPAPPAEVPMAPTGAVPVVWTVSRAETPLTVAVALAARPGVRLTVVLPDWFFRENEESKRAREIFLGLVAQGQVELVAMLPHRPVLPLVYDTDAVKLSTAAPALLPPRFQWPDDVAAQGALAKSAFRRLWRKSPTGLEIPWGAVAGPELELLGKVGFGWVLVSGREPGVYDGGRVTAVVPSPVPAKSAPAARKAWLAGLTDADTGGLRAPLQVNTLEDLAAAEQLAPPASAPWMPVGEFVRSFPREALKPLAPSDLSRWMGTPDANRAWQLLGVARQALEDFKNSGRADVRTLDLAFREIYGAQDGAVFAALASPGGARSSEVKRGFLASLEQVFRLLGAPPPPALRRGFAGGADPGETASAPFFSREGAVLHWRDDAKDDRGPGGFFYPTNKAFPPGGWDLTAFRVEPRTEEIVLRWSLSAVANPGGAPHGFSQALIDTYIDINRLPGAGADALLPGRPGLVEASNAWEYALSVDGWGARLYQPWPGAAPRRVAAFPVKLVPPSTLEVTVPRKQLRGEPRDWGFAVAVMGRDPSSAGGAEPAPMKVLTQPGPDNFGGAAPGRRAPPYIDLLSEGPTQNEVLDGYLQGRDASLPFVRADEVSP